MAKHQFVANTNMRNEGLWVTIPKKTIQILGLVNRQPVKVTIETIELNKEDEE